MVEAGIDAISGLIDPVDQLSIQCYIAISQLWIIHALVEIDIPGSLLRGKIVI